MHRREATGGFLQLFVRCPVCSRRPRLWLNPQAQERYGGDPARMCISLQCDRCGCLYDVTADAFQRAGMQVEHPTQDVPAGILRQAPEGVRLRVWRRQALPEVRDLPPQGRTGEAPLPDPAPADARDQIKEQLAEVDRDLEDTEQEILQYLQQEARDE